MISKAAILTLNICNQNINVLIMLTNFIGRIESLGEITVPQATLF